MVGKVPTWKYKFYDTCINKVGMAVQKKHTNKYGMIAIESVSDFMK